MKRKLTALFVAACLILTLVQTAAATGETNLSTAECCVNSRNGGESCIEYIMRTVCDADAVSGLSFDCPNTFVTKVSEASGVTSGGIRYEMRGVGIINSKGEVSTFSCNVYVPTKEETEFLLEIREPNRDGTLSKEWEAYLDETNEVATQGFRKELADELSKRNLACLFGHTPTTVFQYDYFHYYGNGSCETWKYRRRVCTQYVLGRCDYVFDSWQLDSIIFVPWANCRCRP